MTRLLPALLLPLLLAADKTDGFTPLFDGKTLAGWVPVNAAPETFAVKDGTLVTTGVPTGLLRTGRRYENFVLELEWMHVKPKGNSGLFVWADPLPAVGTPFTRAIEVQVLDGHETKDYTSHGDVFAIWGAAFVPDRPHPSKWMRCLPSEKRALPAGQWNRYRVECNGGALKLSVNGKEVSGGTRSTPRYGYICLEAEGSECRYRNLRIKELPSTKPTEAETCPEAKGHATLFTGTDLRGWKADPKAWAVNPGSNTLRLTAADGGRIATEKEFGDYELLIDAKLPKGRKLHFYGRGKGATGHQFLADPAAAGRWVRYVVTVKGESVTVATPGKAGTGFRTEGAAAKGPIELEADGPAEFANLFVRDLK
ncbi:MAG: family 16 glycoside hydrolase [Gemmataceae bacterium]